MSCIEIHFQICDRACLVGERTHTPRATPRKGVTAGHGFVLGVLPSGGWVKRRAFPTAELQRMREDGDGLHAHVSGVHLSCPST